jgi:hypothetical protein
MRSDASGRFRFRYKLSGQPEALYFVSSTFRGIAYFSSPFRQAVVRGGDADLLVYDTTSDVSSLSVQGRHLVVSAPRGPRREIAEIFEIENAASRTVVARDTSNPLWATHFPTVAESLTVAPGDLGAGTVTFRAGRGELFAPISPGVRQLVVTYRIRAGEFPVTWLLEVLLEEPRAIVEGAGLTETDAVAIDGRTFRRFTARNVPAGATMRVRAPAGAVSQSQAALKVMAVVMAFLLASGMIVWLARRRALPESALSTAPMAPMAPAVPVPPASPSDLLVAELAALDARFERQDSPNAAARSHHEQARAALKQNIVSALARESKQS